MASLSSSIHSILEEFRPELEPFEDVYKDLHQHPELGKQEARTASIAAAHLRKAGYDVTTDIGGHGVTGVLENGDGPTVLLRADMDALPIKERTGLPYASTVEMVDSDGEKKPVMHACGHDSHVTCLMAASTLLANAKDKWSGTLILLFQPDEEHGAGAQAMLDDGLYDKIPKPDIVLGQHLMPSKAGTIRVRSGTAMAAADSFKVTVYGRGSHGAQPQDSIDPIVLAASMILRLQTIVSREIGPNDVASVTCASIHGGKAPNVIPDEVEFLLNIRTMDSAVRDKVLGAVKRIIQGEAMASGVEEKPLIESIGGFPLTVNNPEATQTLREAFTSYFDGEHVGDAPPQSASEDFSNLATAVNVPSVFWFFGGVPAEKWDQCVKEGTLKSLPNPHQANYAPVIQPTLKTGIDAMSLAALTFLKT